MERTKSLGGAMDKAFHWMSSVSRNKTLRRVLFLLTLLSFLCPSTRVYSQAHVRDLTQANLQDMKKILDGLSEFRQLALSDYKKALSQYGSERTIQQFKLFDHYVWPATDPIMSWSNYFTLSPCALGSINNKSQVVGFYHPWSDVFLIMDWKIQNDRAMIDDVEILVGDWIRNKGGSSAFDQRPAWQRKDLFAPAALGIAMAESAKAFEKAFLVKGSAGFRNMLPGLNNKIVLQEKNYPLAAGVLLSHLMKIEIFRNPAPDEDPLFNSLRIETVKVLEMAANKKWQALFSSASETLPVMKELLPMMGPESFQALEVVDFYLGDDENGSLLFLAPIFNANYSLSFAFKGSGKTFRIKRIDFINYSGFYEEFNRRATHNPNKNIK